MQHMNFDTELISHLARQNEKMWNDFSKGGTIQLAHVKADEFGDEMFRGEKSRSRKGVSLEPTQFTDALEILRLKRSLFLQRLQLSQRHCESLKLFLEARSVDFQGLIDSGTPQILESATNYPWNSNIDQYTSSSKSYPSPWNQESIAVLRPAPKAMDSPKHVICNCSALCSDQRSKDKDRKAKKTTKFSLKEIKKKLKCAFRNNQEKKQMTSAISSLDDPPTMKRINTKGGDKTRHNSDTLTPRCSFEHAKMRKGCETLSCHQTATGKLMFSDDSPSKKQEPHIFQEAKKHLSARLELVSKSSHFENYRPHETLGGILRSSEHDFMVPLSLKRNIKHVSVMTDSGRPGWISNDNNPMTSYVDDVKIKEDSSEAISKYLANMRFSTDTENSWTGDRIKDSALQATPSSRLQEIGYLSSASPSSSSTYSPAKFGSIEYGEEYQSPVSVLEPLFMEDAITPKFSLPGQLQPRRIDFEDGDYMNEDEAIHEYVRAVLQAAGFNWNNHLQDMPSQDEILDVSYPYGDILLRIETDIEPQLLVDFVNDVLLELYQQHFGYAPWTSLNTKPNARSLLTEQHFINQVVKEVKGAVFPEFRHATLNQIVGMDVAKITSWLDIRVDIEDLVNQIADDILEESTNSIAVMLST